MDEVFLGEEDALILEEAVGDAEFVGAVEEVALVFHDGLLFLLPCDNGRESECLAALFVEVSCWLPLEAQFLHLVLIFYRTWSIRHL